MEHDRKRQVYFLRITPVNWVVAFVYSLTRPVGYWRSALPLIFLSRFERVPVERDVTRDEWLLISDAAFDLWQSRVCDYLTHSLPLLVDYRKVRIDFSLLLLQHVSQEFERLFQFCRALELARGSGARVIEPWIARALSRELMEEILGRCALVRSAANRLLEAPYEWAFVVGHLARGVLALVRRAGRGAMRIEPGATLWSGIAPPEMPGQDDRLDFAWPSRFAGVPASRIVYFLPVEPSAAQRRHFERHGTMALSPTELPRMVSLSSAWRAFLASCTEALRALVFERSPAAPFRALFAVRAFLWIEIGRTLKPSSYVTTTSHCWPERPEIAALCALGIPAKIWAYSANSLLFTSNAPDFRDLGVSRSAFYAREFWVWNAAYRDWMLRRQVGAEGQRPRFRVVGPLMCGNAGWLDKTTAAARERLGLDPGAFYLAVFDVPRLGVIHRRTFYGGPRMFVDGYHEAFFQGLIDLLDAYPRLRMLFKLKRQTSSPWHDFPDAQLELLDESHRFAREGRVVVIHQDTDPYLPVAACDAALGMPYTSPVLVALTQGKPGAYFDPSGFARHPSERTYADVTLTRYEALEQSVGEWLERRTRPDLEALERLLPLPEEGFDVRTAILGN